MITLDHLKKVTAFEMYAKRYLLLYLMWAGFATIYFLLWETTMRGTDTEGRFSSFIFSDLLLANIAQGVTGYLLFSCLRTFSTSRAYRAWIGFLFGVFVTHAVVTLLFFMHGLTYVTLGDFWKADGFSFYLRSAYFSLLYALVVTYSLLLVTLLFVHKNKQSLGLTISLRPYIIFVSIFIGSALLACSHYSAILAHVGG